jgi:hypothetical protein
LSDLSKNEVKEPRIVIVKKERKIDSMLIVKSQTILTSFEKEESFSKILVYLFAFYFVLNIPYPENFEVVFGFFHEALSIEQPVHFKNTKTKTYSRLLVNLQKSLKQ